MEGADRESSTCTCPTFWKSHICKRVLGIAIRLTKFSVIPEAKNVKLGEKGREGDLPKRPTLYFGSHCGYLL